MSEPNLNDVFHRLGNIEGTVNGMASDIKEVKATTSAMDGRLRTVEQRSATLGALSGGIVAIGVGLLKQKLGI